MQKENIQILNYLSIDEFIKKDKEERKDYKTEGILCFSYSLHFKSALALLCSAFLKSEDIKECRTYGKKLGKLVEKIYDEKTNILNSICFLYNNGNDDFIDCAASRFASELSFPVTLKDGSFHPKLYICKYSDGEKSPVYYRFIVGSENLSSLQKTVLEHGLCFEVKAEQLENALLDEPKGRQPKDRWDEFWNQIESIIKSYTCKDKDKDKCRTIIGRLSKPFKDFSIDHFPEIALRKPPENNENNGNNGICFWKERTFQTNDITKIKIHTPFLGKTVRKLLKKMPKTAEVELYTNQTELERIGAKETNEQNENKVKVHCFTGKESFLNTHYKGYVLEIDESNKYSWTGSLNFTYAAFCHNVELLAKIPGGGNEFQQYERYYDGGCFYEFPPQEGEKLKEQEETLKEQFKKAIKKALWNGNSLCSMEAVWQSGGMTYTINDFAWEKMGKFKENIYTIKAKINQEEVEIKPDTDGTCPVKFCGESVINKVSRPKVMFYLYEGETVLCECGFCLQVNWKEETQNGNENIGTGNSNIMQDIIYTLQTTMEEAKTDSAIFQPTEVTEHVTGTTRLKRLQVIDLESLLRAGTLEELKKGIAAAQEKMEYEKQLIDRAEKGNEEDQKWAKKMKTCDMEKMDDQLKKLKKDIEI